MKIKFAEVSAENNDLNIKQATLESQMRDHTEKLESLSADLQKKIDEKKDIENMKRDLEAEKENLKQEVTQQKNSVLDLQTQISGMRAWENEISELKIQLNT